MTTYSPSWRELIAQLNGTTTFGDPGVRDPEYPCDDFEPVEHVDWLGLEIRSPGGGYCYSDGHYLCGSCANLSDETIADWMAA